MDPKPIHKDNLRSPRYHHCLDLDDYHNPPVPENPPRIWIYSSESVTGTWTSPHTEHIGALFLDYVLEQSL